MADIVTLILPKDKASLEAKYAKKLAEIISRDLSNQQLKQLISDLENSTSR